jgi:hypothetical protein
MAYHMLPWEEYKDGFGNVSFLRSRINQVEDFTPYIATINYVTVNHYWAWEVLPGFITDDVISGKAPTLKAAKRIVDVILEENSWREVKKNVQILA